MRLARQSGFFRPHDGMDRLLHLAVRRRQARRQRPGPPLYGPAEIDAVQDGVRRLEHAEIAHLLVDENVVIPIADGIGLDTARIVILCGLLIALLTLGALGIKRLHARRDEKVTR